MLEENNITHFVAGTYVVELPYDFTAFDLLIPFSNDENRLMFISGVAMQGVSAALREKRPGELVAVGVDCNFDEEQENIINLALSGRSV